MLTDAQGLLREFSKDIDDIESLLRKLKELDALASKGSIDPVAAKKLRDEYSNGIIKAMEHFFDIEEKLEGLRAGLKVDIEQRKKMGADVSEAERIINMIENAYMQIDPNIWVEIAIASLTVFTSAKERKEISEEEFAQLRETYKKFLDYMADKWDYQKAGLEEVRKKTEEELAKVDASMKELTVRYKVGEYDEKRYGELSAPLRAQQEALRQRMEKISDYVDAIDSAVFDCYYLYTHPEERKDVNPQDLLSGLNLPRADELRELLTPGETVDKMYERLYNYYALNMGADRARARLEAEIARYMSQGKNRSEAIRSLYASVMGERKVLFARGLIILAILGMLFVLLVPVVSVSKAQTSPSLATVTVVNDHDFALVNFPSIETIYFSEGQVFIGGFKLVGLTGQALPYQVLRASEYADGSIRSVTIIFPVNAAPLSRAAYYVELGHAPEAANLTLFSKGEYRIENGVFSFYLSNDSAGPLNLSVDGVRLSVFTLPFMSSSSQVDGYQLSSQSLQVRVLQNGPELSELEVSAIAPLSYVENLTVFRGFPAILYRIKFNSSGPYRPLMGYLNASVFTELAYGSSRKNLSSVAPSGSLFPAEPLYSLVGRTPISFSSNASFQYMALGLSGPILAYAYQSPNPTFSALVMPGVNMSYASNISGALSGGVRALVSEPASVLSISYANTVQAYDAFRINVSLFFTHNASKVVLQPHLPYGIVVESPGITEFPHVIGGSSNSSVWTVYANRTGLLSGYFEANGSLVNFTVNCYVLPLLPPAEAVIDVLSAGSPLPGVLVNVSGSGRTWTGITNGTGEVAFTLPLGAYSVTMSRNGVSLGEKAIEVFGSGIYRLSATSVDLLVRPEFENGVPMMPPNSPLLVLRELKTSQTYYSVPSAANGSAEAVFKYLAPGSYELFGIMWGMETTPLYVNLSHSETVTFRMPGLNQLSFRVLTVNGFPLSNATVQLYGAGGIFLTQASTGTGGLVSVAVPAGNYTYMFRYSGVTVAVGSIDVRGSASELVNASASRTAIQVSSLFGPIGNAQVRVYSSNGSLFLVTHTNSSGDATVYLPQGDFVASVSSPAYAGSAPIAAPASSAHVFVGLSTPAWLLIFLTVAGWAGYVALEVKGGGKKEEVAKLKSMIQKLNELYENGEVDFALYNKLNDEYQARLAELTRHEE